MFYRFWRSLIVALAYAVFGVQVRTDRTIEASGRWPDVLHLRAGVSQTAETPTRAARMSAVFARWGRLRLSEPPPHCRVNGHFA